MLGVVAQALRASPGMRGASFHGVFRCPASTLLLAGLGLAACAPLASFRPASGLAPDRSFEAGMGFAVVEPRKYVDESAASADQVWLTGEPSRWLSLTAITAFDTSALGVGGAARIYALRRHRFAVGVEAEGGYGWVGASLPLAARPLEPIWIYAAPRVGNWGVDPLFGVLGGVDVNVQGGLHMRAEMQTNWQNLKYYNKRTIYGFALAYQF